MELLSKLNSMFLYLICGGIILIVAVICLVFAVRAYRMGKALGIDVSRMKRVILASATFAVLPSVGILLGVIALSGSLYHHCAFDELLHYVGHDSDDL